MQAISDQTRNTRVWQVYFWHENCKHHKLSALVSEFPIPAPFNLNVQGTRTDRPAVSLSMWEINRSTAQTASLWNLQSVQYVQSVYCVKSLQFKKKSLKSGNRKQEQESDTWEGRDDRENLEGIEDK